MAQLIELGYMPAPSEQQHNAVELARTEWEFNRAASQLDAGHPAEALAAIEPLHARQPHSPRFALLLAQCYASLGRAADVRRVIEVARADQQEPPASPQADLWLGWALLVSGERAAALAALQRAEQSTSLLQQQSPTIHCMIGRVYVEQRCWLDAQRAFARALEIDPESEVAHDGMAAALLGLGRNEEAASHALRAVGLLHHFPTAHYRLGVALVRLGQYERAARAMEIAVSMRAGLLDAHRYLGALYARLNDPERAMVHRKIARRLWDLRAQPAGAT
jgi:tetratricopeptide (TPR) repeat protein